MPWLRQKALVHSEQDDEADRRALLPAFEEPVSSAERGSSSEPRGIDRRRREDEESPPLPAGPRGIIVLFLKQVHLQKVGAASVGQRLSVTATRNGVG